MCVVCRQLKPRSALLRLRVDGTKAVFDSSGHREGRGMYVCRDALCIEKMCSRKRRARSVRAVADEETVRQLLEEVRTDE